MFLSNVSEFTASIIKKNKISKENNRISNLIWLNNKTIIETHIF